MTIRLGAARGVERTAINGGGQARVERATSDGGQARVERVTRVGGPIEGRDHPMKKCGEAKERVSRRSEECENPKNRENAKIPKKGDFGPPPKMTPKNPQK